jgi:membrane fusion protein (multidrug efflux system)
MRTRRMRAWLVASGGLLGGLLLVGCGGADKPVEATSTAGRAAEPSVVPITTGTAIERQVPTIVRATGTFVADESSDVTSQVAGQVLDTPANVGDTVREGDLLVHLDDRDARLKLQQAEAALEQAKAQQERARAEVARNEELMESGYLSKSAYEALTTTLSVATASVSQATAQLAIASKALDDTTIRAPFAGHITARPVARGEYVNVGATVVTLVRITPIKLQLQVPESAATGLHRGMTVSASVPAYPGRSFEGTLSALNVAIDPASRAMAVEARFPNQNGSLTPGMFASAEVRLAATEPAVFVAGTSVMPVADGQALGVFVVDGDVVRVRVVQTGERDGGLVRILSGLQAGEVVAATNLDHLVEGARVQVEGPAPAQPAASGGSDRK